MPGHPKAVFDGKKFARSLANGPGVYLMRDGAGKPLYVGKAANLRRRVASYFVDRGHTGRIGLMLAKVRSVEVSLTRTEAEALLLENQWIKALKPRYNINLRDDKSYPWIRLSTHREFPKIGFYRGPRSKPGEYFGPYSSAGAVRESLNQVYRLFGLRQCTDTVFANRSRPCLQHQIGRCSAPCVGLISPEDYQRDIAATRAFLEGRDREVIGYLSERMEAASRALDFETAANFRDRIQAISKIQSSQFVADGADDLDVIALARRGGDAALQIAEFRRGNHVSGRSFFPGNLDPEITDEALISALIGQWYAERKPPAELICHPSPAARALLAEALSQQRGGRVRIAVRVRGMRANWLRLAVDNAAEALRRRVLDRDQLGRERAALADLIRLPEPPLRIECFDISHLSGTETVASCVVLDATGLNRSAYRHFNITEITPGDDYAAMRQVLNRRYRRALEQAASLPDLIVVDGGKGQLNVAREVLGQLGLDAIKVLGIAKGPSRRAGYETWMVDDHQVRPGPHHPASLLIQRIRDEAHRFAVRGHRQKRKQRAQQSPLQAIEGIGPVRRQRLLKFFGGLTGVKAAGVEELMRVPGIHRRLAETIWRHLHG